MFRNISKIGLTESEVKKGGQRSLNKRAHSSSPVVMRSKTVTALKKYERRCQSLTPSIHTIKKPIEYSAPTGIDGKDPRPLYTIDNENKDTPIIPQNVLARMLRTLATKKREFFKLRKSFIAQQNTLLESFAQLKDMESRAGAAKDESVGDVRVVSLSGWPAHDLLLLIRDDISIPVTNEISGSLGPSILQQFSLQLNSIPEEIVSVCAEIMARRLELLDLYRSKFRTDKNTYSSERKTKNMEFDTDTEKLHRMVADTAENLKAKISYVYKLAKIPWVDRDTLVKKMDRIQKENLILQNKLDAFVKKENELQAQTDGVPDCQNICEELAKERAAREILKEVVSSAESMLRVARARIATLERHLKDTRAELEASRKKRKELEQLVKRLTNQVSIQTVKLSLHYHLKLKYQLFYISSIT